MSDAVDFEGGSDGARGGGGGGGGGDVEGGSRSLEDCTGVDPSAEASLGAPGAHATRERSARAALLGRRGAAIRWGGAALAAAFCMTW
jgi:hypothetical protein